MRKQVYGICEQQMRILVRGIAVQTRITACADPEEGIGGPDPALPPGKSQNIGFLSIA